MCHSIREPQPNIQVVSLSRFLNKNHSDPIASSSFTDIKWNNLIEKSLQHFENRFLSKISRSIDF
jgi:hypothetical protein